MRYREITGLDPIEEAMAQVARVPSEKEVRSEVLKYATDPEQTAFVPLEPSETGLRRTIWVSQRQKFPYLIVAKSIGGDTDLTTKNGLVVPFNGATLFDDVNEWLRHNHSFLPMLADGSMDMVEFFEKMKRLTLKETILHEMVDVPTRVSNLPRIVWCSPKMASHDIRIKVPTDKGDISIALRPKVGYPKSEAQRLPTKDFNKIANWMRLNYALIEDYWFKRIKTEEFLAKVKPLP